jgi:putative membrane protein
MTNRKTSTLLLLAVALIASVVVMAVIGALAFSTNGGDMDDMMNGGWGWGMGAFMIVPAIILILIVVVAIGGLEEKTVYVQQQQSPLDILNQRLARGEISQEEYERIRTRLA